MVTIDILVADPAWQRLLPDPQAWAQPVLDRAVSRLPEDTVGADAEVSLLLADDEAVRILNRDYRGKDAPTNVLSFPSAPMPGTALPDMMGPLLGDIAMARETIEAEADIAGLPFQHHASHLLVHGFLHLLGFDHVTDADAAIMEGLEIDILKTLDIADPYGDDVPRQAHR